VRRQVAYRISFHQPAKIADSRWKDLSDMIRADEECPSNAEVWHVSETRFHGRSGLAKRQRSLASSSGTQAS